MRHAPVVPLVLTVLLLSAPAAAGAQTTYSLYGCHDTWSCHWATVEVTPNAAFGAWDINAWLQSVFYTPGLILEGRLDPVANISFYDWKGYYIGYRSTDGFFNSAYAHAPWSPDGMQVWLSYGPEGGFWPQDEAATGVAHLTVTPEPTTTALAATGLALLAAVRRRRRRDEEEETA